MMWEFPYQVSCTSIETQNELIRILSAWANSLNQRIASLPTEPLAVQIYRQQTLAADTFKMSRETAKLLFADEAEEAAFLAKPMVVNGLSIQLNPYGSFSGSRLSFIFIDCPESSAHGKAIGINENRISATCFFCRFDSHSRWFVAFLRAVAAISPDIVITIGDEQELLKMNGVSDYQELLTELADLYFDDLAAGVAWRSEGDDEP